MDVERGIDPSAYVDPDVFLAERRRVFGGSWLPVCRVEDVARAGDHVATTLAGDPVVVTRTHDGDLAAMSNVCRHRNMVLVEGRGNAAALRCRYHHWTYRLDGTLASAPLTAEVDGLDTAAFCLPRLAVEVWHGFVLVNTDLDATPFAEQVSGLDELLAPIPVADLVRVGSITWDQPWNWKLTVENYAESYHHRAVHGDTLQPLFPGELSRPRTGGDQPWMCLEHDLAADVGGEVGALLVVAAYPLLLPTFVGTESMTWLRLEVHDAGHSTLTTEVFTTPERAADPDAVAFEIEAVRAVNAQDEVPNRGVAAGLASRWAVAGTHHPLEAALTHFADWYRGRLAA